MFSSKYSGVALYVHQKYLPYLKVHTLNQFVAAPQQARGAVGVVCSIMGRTILFLTCQLDAKDNDRRRRQFVDITTTLGSLLGERGYHLNEQFHHIIWCGAFNYGLLDISGNPLPCEIALKMLKDHLNITLYDTHDQLNQEKRSHHVFFGYREANPFPNFYPTYKKLENRPPLNYSDQDGAWLKQCYRVRHKEPFFKGGKTRETTPTYCDRVLYHSLADLATDLLPEPVAVDLTLLAASGHGTTVVNNISTLAQRTTTKMIDNYQAVNDGEGMSISDHSPVFGTFLLRLFHDHAANMVLAAEEQDGSSNSSSSSGSGGGDGGDGSLTPARESVEAGVSAGAKGTPARAGSGENGSLRSRHGSSGKLIYMEGSLQSSKGSRGNSLCDYGAGNAAGSAPVSPLKKRGSGSGAGLAADMGYMSVSGSRDNEARNLMGEFEGTPGRRTGSGAGRPPVVDTAALLGSPRGVSAFSGGSLLPPGPYTIRLSNFRVLWGTMDSSPAAVRVLFPLPYEALAGETFVDFFSEIGGVGGGIAAGASKQAGAGAWRREHTHSRTGTSLPLVADVPSEAGSGGGGVIAPLQLVWKGDEALDKLHMAFRVAIPHGSFDSSSSSKGGKKDSDRDKKAGAGTQELSEGHCAVGLEKLCKLALCAADHTAANNGAAATAGSGGSQQHVHVKTSVAQLLLKDGVPMYNIDSNSLQRELVTWCCTVELIIQNETW